MNAVTARLNTDRHLKCASCKATAHAMIFVDGHPAFSSCKRHLALNASRAKALVGKPRCQEPRHFTGDTCNVVLADDGTCPVTRLHAR